WRIFRLTKTLVEFRVVGLPRRKALCGNIGTFQNSLKTLGLGASVGMIRNVQDEKRRNAFVLRHMIDRRVVGMFGGIIPELLAVTPFRLRQAVHAAAGFSGFNDRRHVVGVAIDRNTTL